MTLEVNMNALEKHEKNIAHDMCLLYGGNPEEMYEIMNDAVIHGRLTFDSLAYIIRHTIGLWIEKGFDIKTICEISKKASVEGLNPEQITNALIKIYHHRPY